MNATKCGGYCHADTHVKDKFVINVWNETTGQDGHVDTYWNDVLYVTIDAISDYVIKGFAVTAINKQGTVVGKAGRDVEGSTAFHKHADPNRTSVTLQWKGPGQNFGDNSLDLPIVFKKLLRSASSKFGPRPLDIFEKTFPARRDLGYDTSLEDPFEPLKQQLLKAATDSKSQPATGNDVTNSMKTDGADGAFPQGETIGATVATLNAGPPGQNKAAAPIRDGGLTVVTGEVNPALTMFGSEDTGGDNLVNVNGNLQLSQGDGTGNDVTAADLLPDILNALDVIVEGDVVDSGVSAGADTPAQDGLTGNANVNSIGDINTGSKVPAGNGEVTPVSSPPVSDNGDSASGLTALPVINTNVVNDLGLGQKSDGSQEQPWNSVDVDLGPSFLGDPSVNGKGVTGTASSDEALPDINTDALNTLGLGQKTSSDVWQGQSENSLEADLGPSFLGDPSRSKEPRVLAMESTSSSRSQVTPVVINVPARQPANTAVFRGSPSGGAPQNAFPAGGLPFGAQSPAGFGGAGGAAQGINAFGNPAAGSSPFGGGGIPNNAFGGANPSAFGGASPNGFGGAVPNAAFGGSVPPGAFGGGASSPFLPNGGAAGGVQSSPFGLQSAGPNQFAQQQLLAQAQAASGNGANPFGSPQGSIPFGFPAVNGSSGVGASPFSGAGVNAVGSVPFGAGGGAGGNPLRAGSPFGGPSGSPFGGPSGSPFGGPSGSPFGTPAGNNPFPAGGVGASPFNAAGNSFGNSAPLSPFSAAAASPFTGPVSRPFLGGNASSPFGVPGAGSPFGVPGAGSPFGVPGAGSPFGVPGAGSPFGNTNPLGFPGSPVGANPFSSANSLNPFSSASNPFAASSGLNPFGNSQNPFGNSQNPFGNSQNPFGNRQNPFGNSQNPFAPVGGFNPFGSSGRPNQLGGPSSGLNPFARSAGGSPFGFPGASNGFGGSRSGSPQNLNQLLGLMSSSLLGRSAGSSGFGGRSGVFGGSPFGSSPFGGRSPFGGGFPSPFRGFGFPGLGGGFRPPGSSLLSSRG
ncbi:hypothetical protein BaRGS_00006927 [Batillaria attramentaria]|uniref:Uncharacterized protein n=1 Tax=Batillaria attramentaria TaxID=370345 RepID=A0ABD0LRP1_9CAEN